MRSFLPRIRSRPKAPVHLHVSSVAAPVLIAERGVMKGGLF